MIQWKAQVRLRRIDTEASDAHADQVWVSKSEMTDEEVCQGRSDIISLRLQMLAQSVNDDCRTYREGQL